jgi:hypothetical protein
MTALQPLPHVFVSHMSTHVARHHGGCRCEDDEIDEEDLKAMLAMNVMESMKEKAASDHHEEEAAPMKAVQRSSTKAMMKMMMKSIPA